MESDQNVTARKRCQEFVAKHKRWLVDRGNAIGEEAKANREWLSQARSIWEAARTETEPRVILNLLRYQRARNEKTWTEPKDVFKPLYDDVEKCIGLAEKSAGNEEVALELIRHLMVYTIRSYVFHNKSERKQKGAT